MKTYFCSFSCCTFSCTPSCSALFPTFRLPSCRSTSYQVNVFCWDCVGSKTCIWKFKTQNIMRYHTSASRYQTFSSFSPPDTKLEVISSFSFSLHSLQVLNTVKPCHLKFAKVTQNNVQIQINYLTPIFPAKFGRS